MISWLYSKFFILSDKINQIFVFCLAGRLGRLPGYMYINYSSILAFFKKKDDTIAKINNSMVSRDEKDIKIAYY